MNEFVMYKLLDLVSKKETIGVLFKLGYSYSSIINWFSDLEQLGYIYTEEDISKFITQKGQKKLTELEKKYKNRNIGILEQYKTEQLALDDVYLP